METCPPFGCSVWKANYSTILKLMLLTELLKSVDYDISCALVTTTFKKLGFGLPCSFKTLEIYIKTLTIERLGVVSRMRL